MDDLNLTISGYREEIAETEKRLGKLRSDLAKAEQQQQQQHRHAVDADVHSHTYEGTNTLAIQENGVSGDSTVRRWPLGPEEYKRYGRHLILDRVGLQGQQNLNKASALIVGIGGLGSPAAAYLAGAGVGTIGLMDGDVVEISNLHRQIIHSTSTVGNYKVDSAARYLRQLNPLSNYKTYPDFIHPKSAIRLFEEYDLILDCTDNPATRYLISDAAVLTGKPLISASALGMEGQLLVLNDTWQVKDRQPGRYCYRCVFPRPPPAETVLTCGEGGIFGPVVGVMGVLMATAALKILIRGVSNHSGSFDLVFGVPPEQPSMLLYSAVSEPMFRNVRIKGRRESCPSCSTEATITEESLLGGTMDYGAFCGLKNSTGALNHNERIMPSEYTRLISRLSPQQRKNVFVFDVRPKAEYDLGHIEDSINLPIQDLSNSSNDGNASAKKVAPSPHLLHQQGEDWDQLILPPNVRCAFTICRHGNDSQLAARLLKTQRTDFDHLVDIKGGLEAWRKEVDPTFPDY